MVSFLNNRLNCLFCAFLTACTINFGLWLWLQTQIKQTVNLEFKPSQKRIFFAQRLFPIIQAPIRMQASVSSLKGVNLKAAVINGKNSLAVLEKNNKTKIIRLKQTYERHQLIEVQSKCVIFLNPQNQIVILKFKNKKMPSPQPMNTKSTAIKHYKYIQVEPQRILVSSKLIQKFKKNPQSFAKNIDLQSFLQNKQLQGFKVSFVKKGSVFEQIGLKKEDIITAINSQPLTIIDNAIALYNRIDQIDSLYLTILRNGSENEFYFEKY